MILKIDKGSIPAGVGLERLRWTGKALVDLADLDEIWCEHKNGAFLLHAIEVPYSQLVKMSYKDRKKLWNDNGVYKIKSDAQVRGELNLQYRKSHYPNVGDQLDAILKYLENKTDLPDELQNIINLWQATKTKYPKVE